MNPAVVLLIVLVAAALVLGLVVAKGRSNKSPRLPLQEMPLGGDLLFRVRQLLGEGKKIQAIKELRDSRPGLGLREAKELVEAIEAGHEPAVVAGAAGGGAPTGLPGMPLSGEVLFRVRQLLGEGKKIQAIKELRDSQPELGLKEAKELVEAIEAGHEPPVLTSGDQPPPEVPPGPADLAERVRRLRDSGQDTRAIQLVCEETGMGIVDAQKFVKSLG